MSLLVEKVCDVCQEEFSTTTAMKLHKKVHEDAAKVFKEVVLDPKPKCKYGDCEHSEEDHEAAICWHIVKPELKDVPDDSKFCGCHKIAQLNHSWEIKKRRNPIDGEGWQDPKYHKHDKSCKENCKKEGESPYIMITKVCKVCRDVCLIRVDSNACSDCR
jgi:hypothetical protein